MSTERDGKEEERRLLLVILKELQHVPTNSTMEAWWSIAEKTLPQGYPVYEFSDGILGWLEDEFDTGNFSGWAEYRDTCAAAIALLESDCSVDQIESIWEDIHLAVRRSDRPPEEVVREFVQRLNNKGE